LEDELLVQQFNPLPVTDNKKRNRQFFATVNETFAGHLFLFTFKKGGKYNRMNILNISRITF